MSVIEEIHHSYSGKIITRCSENRCRLQLSGLGDKIILKGELVCRDKKICDCFVYTIHEDTLYICLVELKSKSVHASQIEEKFNNSLEKSFEILGSCTGDQTDPKFLTIVLARNWQSQSEFRILKSKRITFMGKSYSIIPKRCGQPLLEIIKHDF